MFQATIECLENGDYPPQHALLILQNGDLVLEQYWPGEDLVYGVKKQRDFGPESLHGMRSCTKSVVGLLVGIANHDGLLPSIDAPAFELFADLELETRDGFTEAYRTITLKHLLTMTDGLDWQQYESQDHVNNESEFEQSANAAAYVWSQPMKRISGRKLQLQQRSHGLTGQGYKTRVRTNHRAVCGGEAFRAVTNHELGMVTGQRWRTSSTFWPAVDATRDDKNRTACITGRKMEWRTNCT